jgi:hypothetical protein
MAVWMPLLRARLAAGAWARVCTRGEVAAGGGSGAHAGGDSDSQGVLEPVEIQAHRFDGDLEAAWGFVVPP